jgi:hypothetical protein
MEMETLNKKLEKIKKKIKVSWENGKIIKEINKAIKSKYNTTKEATIKKYGSSPIYMGIL